MFDKTTVIQRMFGRWIAFYMLFTKLVEMGREHRGPCPLHNGVAANFAVNPDTGEWYCHSECGCGGDAFEFLCKLRGITFTEALAELAAFSRTVSASEPMVRCERATTGRHIVATYDYVDENGTLLFQVVRYEPKGFAQRRPGPTGWINDLQGVRRVLYRLPDVHRAVGSAQTIYVVEGEKDVDVLNNSGCVATCNPMGAGKWTAEYTEVLSGAHVVILPDNDDPGRRHADTVANSLSGIAQSVRVVHLPGLPDKGDVTDWFASGKTVRDLDAIVNATPAWSPSVASGASCAVTTVGSRPLQPRNFPVMDPRGFYGLAGDIVRAIDPHTESDPVAILIQTLVAFGNCIGRSAYFQAEADRHFGNLFAVLVGVSSKGRKGTSWGHVRRLIQTVDPGWESVCVASGLTSGEGLIYHVRDPIEKERVDKNSGESITVVEDGGVTDKRLLVIESEFALVLRQTQRDGNTLSATVRNAWDTGDLQTLSKNSPVRATGAHVSIIGHITADELKRYLTATETANGFGNRFLWVAAKRSKCLPDGGMIDTVDFTEIQSRLCRAIEHARSVSSLSRDEGAREIWHAIYEDLSDGYPGLRGSLTGRAEAQTMRIALLFALLDCDIAIRANHLLAAIAVWEYCDRSVAYTFGESLGDPVADTIVATLREQPSGLSRDQIRELFGRNQTSSRIEQALAVLQNAKLASCHRELADGKGRPRELWTLTP